MYGLFMIAKNNMKKQKGDMITFFVLTFIAAFLIFDCISVFAGLGTVMDERFKRVYGAHVMICSNDTEEENDSAARAFKENEHIAEYESTPLIRFTSDYKNKKQSEYMQYMFLVEDAAVEKKLMKINDTGINCGKNDILIPRNMKAGFAIGDILQLKFDKNVYEFNVAGYIDDPYFCSTVNITVYSVCMSKEMIDELCNKEADTVQKRCWHKGRVADGYLNGDRTTQNLEEEINEKYKEYLGEYAKKDPGVNQSDYLCVNWDMMRGGSQFIPMIIMAVMLVFAALIMIIAMVIISFSIKNFIQKNMTNTGILEASGYTVAGLRGALIIQLALVAVLGALAGLVAAALSFKKFGDVVSLILGLEWNRPVNMPAAVITLLILAALSALVALILSAAYKKISVLDALRGGINTHNHKRNCFSFENTPLPVPLVLSLKEFAGGIGRNLLMVFISMLLVISTLIGFGLMDNFGKDPASLMKIMAFELADASVRVKDKEGYIDKDLRKLPGVANVLVQTGFEPTVKYGDKKNTIFTYAVDDLNNTIYTNMLEGRYPEKDNEIMITAAVAENMGLKIGDTVTMEYADKAASYLITGINQRMERMGRTIYMRLDGAEKLVSGDISRMCGYGVTAVEGVSFEELSARIEAYEKENDLEINISNEKLVMESTLKSISGSMSAICMAIAVITVLIVVFVESLVIRAKISREWRNMGISKAIGQTSGGLITQIMFSNIPAIAIGALIGVLLSGMAGGAMVKAAFSLFVIKNVCFRIAPLWRVICYAGIILVSVATAAMAGLKVRSLKPIEMITEE
ncbi:MAG: ABC transporter permease [Lachnospiraceae bacterium]|nr:ABC transporter permease [Lachnospiraceae bacterium]